MTVRCCYLILVLFAFIVRQYVVLLSDGILVSHWASNMSCFLCCGKMEKSVMYFTVLKFTSFLGVGHL